MQQTQRIFKRAARSRRALELSIPIGTNLDAHQLIARIRRGVIWAAAFENTLRCCIPHAVITEELWQGLPVDPQMEAIRFRWQNIRAAIPSIWTMSEAQMGALQEAITQIRTRPGRDEYQRQTGKSMPILPPTRPARSAEHMPAAGSWLGAYRAAVIERRHRATVGCCPHAAIHDPDPLCGRRRRGGRTSRLNRT